MKAPAKCVVTFLPLAAAVAWSLSTIRPHRATRPAPWTDAQDTDVEEESATRWTHGDPLLPPRSTQSYQPGYPSAVVESPPVPAAPPLESLRLPRPSPAPPGERELAAAPEVSLAHRSLAPSGNDDQQECVARELRGWLRVECPAFAPSVSVLGGSTAGVSVKTDGAQAVITMPLAPGDVRVLQIARIGSDYWDGAGFVPVGILSESWVGTTGPHVAIHAPAQVFGMR